LCITFFTALAAAQQISLTPSTLSFGTVAVGSSQSQTVVVKNTTNRRIGIFQASISGTGYTITGISCPVELRIGESRSFNVTYTPLSTETDTGLVSLVTDNWWKVNRIQPSTSVVTLSGSGVANAAIAASPASLSFGTVQVGNNAMLSETLTNTGGATVTISQANVTGTGFTFSGLTLPTTLTSGQSVTFTATFTPAATGAASGTLAILSDASNSTLNIALSGSGGAPGQLSINPTTLNFGNVIVNQSSALTGSLTATGASVTISSGTNSSGEFVLTGITFPKTIAAAQSAPFTVTFTPNASGAASASLTFQSNASNSPTIETLTGAGVVAQQHNVDLTWNASQSQGVIGYNVYRSSVSGSGYTKVNGPLNADTSYTDSTVTSGQTYYYVAKAVDVNNVESGPSSEVQTTVPNP
jgi:hypothetical protein